MTSTRKTHNSAVHVAILAAFILGSLPLYDGPIKGTQAPADTQGLPASLIIALSATCLGGGPSPAPHRPCDKGVCHAALSGSRKVKKLGVPTPTV